MSGGKNGGIVQSFSIGDRLPDSGILDAFEFLDYFTRLWRFIVSPQYRQCCLATWRMAHWPKRLLLTLESVISVVCGLGPFWLVYYLAVS